VSELIINGKKTDLPTGISITELLRQLNLDRDKIVIEVNSELISKDQYASILLKQDDQVEIISFVGGG
jgi:sulfur carrier protein